MSQSQILFERAKQLIPGGVNSPVRAFKSVDLTPPFIKSGKGAYLFDVDGNRYIDYVLSWGPLILGHAHPDVVKASQEALLLGSSFGAPTPVEVALAEKVLSFFPSMDQVRFVSSGTEACMSAIRLARGFTKRNKIIKFAGCYHGHADSLLVNAGSGSLTFGVPSSLGVTAGASNDTLVCDYNDLDAVLALFEKYPQEIAAVIVEPVAGNMNLVMPNTNFLTGLRSLCDHYQTLLIFDEVITGFRVGMHSAQGYFNVQPDLTILGKIIGGGFPAALFGGRNEIMNCLSPLGPVYQAGTLSGNPVAMAAGLATLNALSEPKVYDQIITLTETLVNGLNSIAETNNIPFHANSIGAMFGFYFTDNKSICNEADIKKTNNTHFKRFFAAMLKEGIYFAPSPFEIGFMSHAHTLSDIELTISTAEKIFKTF